MNALAILAAISITAIHPGSPAIDPVRPAIDNGTRGAPTWADPTGTLFHLWFTGTAIKDTKGNTWTNVGAASIQPKNGSIPPGAGTFTTTKYLKLDTNGSGADPGDVTDDFFIVVAFYPTSSISGNPTLFDNHVYGVSGYRAVFSGATSIAFQVSNGANATGPGFYTIQANQVNAYCAARYGSRICQKANASAISCSTPAGTPAASATSPFYVGMGNGITVGMLGYVYEIIFVHATPGASDGAVNTTCAGYINQIKSKYGVTAW